MELLRSFLILIFVFATYLSHSEAEKKIPPQDLEEWQNFKVRYVKSYATKEEALKRRKTFLGNLKFIKEHNIRYDNGTESFKVAVNKFADLTPKEFAAKMTGYKKPQNWQRKGQPFSLTEFVDLSQPVDWRKKGAVTDVRDQKNCSASWAFSAVGSLEGQVFIKKGKLKSLSPQNLIDCCYASYGNEGCSGGVMDNAFEFIKDNGGLDSEMSYNYQSNKGACKYNKPLMNTACSGYVDLPSGCESNLQNAVANVGPVAAAIDASHQSFMLYHSGTYSSPDCSSTDVNHGVLVVGYGTSSTGDYWIVKNSWGKDWGLSGYFMLDKFNGNMCGIATEASYPMV